MRVNSIMLQMSVLIYNQLPSSPGENSGRETHIDCKGEAKFKTLLA